LEKTDQKKKVCFFVCKGAKLMRFLLKIGRFWTRIAVFDAKKAVGN